ncbi:MAG TPA: hypothetical protein VJB97_03140, partial [Candidatus Paceibacterota bacterium]
MNEFAGVAAAMAGGLLPALAWLWFWLREDSVHPEPRRLIALAFFAGMVTVAIVIPIENALSALVSDGTYIVLSAGAATTLIFALWSIIEEVCKYIAA